MKLKMPFLALGLLLVQSIASAQVPFPTREKFDLANGEEYNLIGWIHARPDGKTEFEIDLESQPWLATSARRSDPFIRIGGVSRMSTYAGKKVSIKVTAEGFVDRSSGCEGKQEYQVMIHLNNDPRIQN